MGADIDGAIEARGPGGGWQCAVDLLDFGLGRDRHAWDCLFGFGSELGVERPLFEARGLPGDASAPVAETAALDAQYGHTHATWSEIAAVDWDAPLCDAPAYSLVGVWRPGPDGELALDDVIRVTVEILDAAEEQFGADLMPPEWPEGGEVRMGDEVYRALVLTARTFVEPDGGWQPVWTAMRELAARYGDDNVRLVVWFG
ncbi:hypothetical protein QNN03_29735 [Streptomyces sp. GXMU-J15]|uniref:DUF1877 family protein n=1 Tax=Streptomyces fuscus TaxID=3048495 RepID=A0ABT7J8A9_9ACTN|nr:MULTISPECIES: hypothetical protein [Streptomyces]MDL2080636.1 hypothetical protein [Streptomyces fuscus]